MSKFSVLVFPEIGGYVFEKIMTCMSNIQLDYFVSIVRDVGCPFVFEKVGVQHQRITIAGLLLYWFTPRRLMEAEPIKRNVVWHFIKSTFSCTNGISIR